MDSPLMKRAASRDTGHHGRVAEKKSAKRLRAVLQPGSGAMAGAKGDMQLGKFLVENKVTKYRSFALKQEYLTKIYLEALEIGMHPALALQFTNEAGASTKRERWVIIPESLFEQIAGVFE